jgi:hypothetical protein
VLRRRLGHHRPERRRLQSTSPARAARGLLCSTQRLATRLPRSSLPGLDPAEPSHGILDPADGASAGAAEGKPGSWRRRILEA